MLFILPTRYGSPNSHARMLCCQGDAGNQHLDARAKSAVNKTWQCGVFAAASPAPALGCVGTPVKRFKLDKRVTSDSKLRLSL